MKKTHKKQLPAENSDFSARLIEVIQRHGTFTALDSFKTNDKLSADTFADLSKKHAAVYGEGATVSLESLFGTTDTFIEGHLSRPQGEVSISAFDTRLSLFCHGDLDVASLPVFDIDSERFGIYKRIKRDGALAFRRASVISLLPAIEMPYEKYSSIATTIIAITENLGIISHPTVIDKRGVIGLLCDLGVGASVDIVSYPVNNECDSFQESLYKFTDMCAFVIEEGNKPKLLEFLNESGLIAVECARLCRDEMITFFNNGKELASLSINAIKNNETVILKDVISSPQYSPESALVCSLPLSASSSIPPRREDVESVFTTLTGAASCASCDINEYSMQNVMLTVLRTVFELVVKGADRRSIRLSKKLSFTDDCDTSHIVDTALALHRVQTELVLPSEGNKLDFDADNNRASIFATGTTASTENMPSDHFFGDMNNIYILSGIDADVQRINFETVRRLLDYIHFTVRQNNVLSARVFFNTPITEALASMNTENIELVTRDTSTLKCPLLYVIATSKGELRGTSLGYTRAPSADEE